VVAIKMAVGDDGANESGAARLHPQGCIRKAA